MCGILGYLRTDSGAGRYDLKRAIAALAHRGPDDAGEWSEGAAGLGFVRLAIIDLSPAGHQPMLSPDGRYIIVFNGEIYNFPESAQRTGSSGRTISRAFRYRGAAPPVPT
jgi:asparagine synthase (glutamine-hydrolysing)